MPGSEERAHAPLTTWKEIAAYLDVSVRTAQNWERTRGLPVKRRGSEKKARAIAYPEDLDAWLREQTASSSAATTGERPALVGAAGWRPLAAAFALVLIGAIAWIAVQNDDAPDPWASTPGLLSVDSDWIRVSSGGDQPVIWKIAAAGLDTPIYETYMKYSRSGPPFESTVLKKDRPYWIEQLPGETGLRLWFVSRPRGDSSDVLQCYDASGQLLWQHEFGKIVTEPLPNARTFRVFEGGLLGLVSVEGSFFVVTRAWHHAFYAMRLALRDAITGEVVEEFWNPGRLTDYEFVDLDGDGRDELLFGGHNHPGRGPGHAALGALKIPFSEAGIERVSFLVDQEAAKPWRYRLFATPDVLVAAGRTPAVSWITVDRDLGRIEARVGFGGNRMFHHLDLDLQPIGAFAADNLRTLHYQLSEKGALDHYLEDAEVESWGRSLRFEVTPNGNDPLIYDELTPRRRNGLREAVDDVTPPTDTDAAHYVEDAGRSRSSSPRCRIRAPILYPAFSRPDLEE